MPKRLLASFLLLCLLPGVLLDCKREEKAAPAAKKEPDVTGIYLMGTGFHSIGLTCLRIEKDEKGNLVVEEVPRDLYLEWRAEFRNERLVLTNAASAEGARQIPAQAGYSRSFGFKPSSSAPGDWDLAQISQSFPSSQKGAESGDLEKTETTLDPPVSSYLHRHEDKRMVEFFNLPCPSPKEQLEEAKREAKLLNSPSPSSKDPEALQEERISRRFALASALVADHPDDPYSRILYLEMLSWKNDWPALVAQIKEWEPRFVESNLALPFQLVKETLRAHELSAAGRNAADLLSSIFSRQCDLATAYQKFPEVLNYTEMIYPPALGGPPNFLPAQILTKVLGVGAVFMMLEGRRDDALCILCSEYHMGQLMSQNGNLIMRLIGCAVRAITCNQLELFALNCCETPPECEQMWKTLEQLNQWEKVETLDDLFQLERTVAPHLRPVLRKVVQPNMEEALTRFRCTRSHFQLIRAATAAWHHLLRTGAFPQQATDFAPLLPAGPPPDPHKPDAPLRFRMDGDQFLCYGVGPDQQDDQGTIIYNPTNGTKSQGDIVVRIPRERKYPFPREGVWASSRSDLLRQFPNGLPPDLFADTRGKPLGVTDTTPVYVYSYGPDTDESGGIEDPQTKQRRKRTLTDFPEVAYDPTNGSTSNGDLFIAIPPR
jgi:hypothetical protein